MYYVLQVAPGMEDQTEILIRGRIKDSVYGSCFHPLRHVRKKFRGEWRDFHEKLMPGYVFITSNSVQELYQELQKIPLLTKVLGKDEEYFVPLQESEISWLNRLAGAAEERQKGVEEFAGKDADQSRGFLQSQKHYRYEVGLSQILVEKDKITILSGPLKNLEKQVKRYHLHKRIAEVEVEFMGRKHRIYLGVEMMERKEDVIV